MPPSNATRRLATQFRIIFSELQATRSARRKGAAFSSCPPCAETRPFQPRRRLRRSTTAMKRCSPDAGPRASGNPRDRFRGASCRPHGQAHPGWQLHLCDRQAEEEEMPQTRAAPRPGSLATGSVAQALFAVRRRRRCRCCSTMR